MNIIERESIFKGYYHLERIKIQSKKTGKTSEREQFHTPDSVGVLVHDTINKEIILVKQFRVGPEKQLVEIVAGKIEGKDQDLERTVHREVLEEVGYQIDKLVHLHRFYTTPGPVTECMNLYYAQVSKQISKGGGLEAENEEIEIIRLSENDFKTYPFEDAKSIMAQQAFILQVMN